MPRYPPAPIQSMPKHNRPIPPALVKLLEAILAIATLELAFFLFRVGAEWWRR